MSADAVRHALYGSDYRPQSKLAEYRPISRSATTKVSPLCLGAMNFGEGWCVERDAWKRVRCGVPYGSMAATATRGRGGCFLPSVHIVFREPFLGPCKKDEAEQIFVEFIRAGGNFIDTAVNYQCGDSEEWCVLARFQPLRRLEC